MSNNSNLPDRHDEIRLTPTTQDSAPGLDSVAKIGERLKKLKSDSTVPRAQKREQMCELTAQMFDAEKTQFAALVEADKDIWRTRLEHFRANVINRIEEILSNIQWNQNNAYQQLLRRMATDYKRTLTEIADTDTLDEIKDLLREDARDSFDLHRENIKKRIQSALRSHDLD